MDRDNKQFSDKDLEMMGIPSLDDTDVKLEISEIDSSSHRENGKIGKSHRVNGMNSKGGYGYEEPIGSETKQKLKRSAAKASRRDTKQYLKQFLD